MATACAPCSPAPASRQARLTAASPGVLDRDSYPVMRLADRVQDNSRTAPVADREGNAVIGPPGPHHDRRGIRSRRWSVPGPPGVLGIATVGP